MTNSLIGFLEEFDDLSSEVMSAPRNDFAVRLKHFISFLESDDDNLSAHIQYLKGRLSWEEIEAAHLRNSRGMGGSHVQLPEDQLNILSLYLNVVERMVAGKLNPEQFALAYFRGGSTNIDAIHRSLLANMIRPFISDLRRYLRKQYDEIPPSTDGIALIPASNRAVALDHNSLHASLVKEIGELEEQLRGDNTIPPDDRQQITKELEAGRTVLSGTKARIIAIGAVVVAPLYWVLEKMAGSVAGEIAKKALSLLESYIPNILELVRHIFSM